MRNLKLVNDEDISLSSDAQNGILVFLGVIFIVIQIVIMIMFREIHFFPGVIVFLLILIPLFNLISKNVGMNKACILLNAFSKKQRAVFQGFNWKLPWENIEYEIDLESKIASERKVTCPTADYSVIITASIMSKPDSGEGEPELERSRKMITHVRNDEETIKGMQGDKAEEIIREKVNNLPAKDVKDAKANTILSENDFDELEKILAIKIIDCPVKDVDYNEETQKALNTVTKAEVLVRMVEALEKAGYTNNEAKALAPLLDKDINLKKQIFEANISGLTMSPELITLISNLSNKLGGTK